MNILHAILLGIIQGITEFLPVSSSGHLAVMQRVFGIGEASITFAVLVHIGSLTAVIIVFRKDIYKCIKTPFSKMTGLLIVGTVPAVIAGVFLKNHIEAFFETGISLACAFTMTGLFLMAADRFKKGNKTEKDITYLDAAVIGCMQAIGIPPGISRSGATITGALARGLDRETAARFSFLLSIIAITGAGVLEARDIVNYPISASADIWPMVFGFLSSALAGYFSIRLLLQLIKACKLCYFSYYVMGLAMFIFLDTFITKIYF